MVNIPLLLRAWLLELDHLGKILVLFLSRYVISGNFFNLSLPKFAHVGNKDDNLPSQDYCENLMKLTNIKCSKYCLVYSKYSGIINHCYLITFL